MKLSRKKIQAMIETDGLQRSVRVNNGGGGGGGAGVSEAWVDKNYVSIEFFNRLFTAYKAGATESDPDIAIEPNDTESIIKNIKAKSGLWTDQFMSALGQNSGSGGGGGGATRLDALSDVAISNPTNGQVLKYNSTTGKWYNGTDSGVSSVAWGDITGKPSTISGYGISDAYISGGTITLGSNSITPITSSDLSGWSPIHWTAIVKGKTWSRICYSDAYEGVTGTTFMLNIQATRGCVVYNNTYIIKSTHAAGYSRVTKIAGSPYTVVAVRTINDASGNVYVEVYDDGNNIATTTTQSVKCVIYPIKNGTITTYSSFTDGTTIPSNWSTGQYIADNKSLSAPTIAANTFYGSLVGNADSATYATTAGSASASDVYAWAKAANKPSYTLDEVSDGTTRKLANYLPLAGGTMSNTTVVTNLNADLLDGQNGSYYAAASDVTTLQGYFTSGSANTAVKLKTARTIWGQSFDGSGNVNGVMTFNGAVNVSYDTYIDNINQYGLRFYFANGNEGIFLKQDGNVGIGTTSPATKLDVQGDISIGTRGGSGTIGCAYSSNNTNRYNYIKFNGGNTNGDIEYVAGTWTGSDHIGHRFYGWENNALKDVLVIKTGGSVGIGTNNPLSALHVKTNSGSILYSSGDATLKIYSTNGIYSGTEHETAVIQTSFDDTDPETSTYPSNYSKRACLALQPRGGYVGIGTTSPSYKLHVSGDIYATGGVSCLSDERFKTIKGETLVTVDQIAKMPSIKYTWNDGREDKDVHVGSIAQRWMEVLPEVVLRANDEVGTLSINYGVAAMIASITTARKVVDHERRIKELEKENMRLRTEIQQLTMKGA